MGKGLTQCLPDKFTSGYAKALGGLPELGVQSGWYKDLKPMTHMSM